MKKGKAPMLRKIVFTGFVVAATASVAFAGDVMFAYRFEPGSSQRYRLKLTTEMEVSGMELSQMADMTAKVTCASADKGQYSMNVVFEKVDASNTIAGNMQTDPSAPKMVGKSVNFLVDANGNVSNITPGPDFDVWQSVQQVVEPTLKSWYVYLPARAVPVGGTWKRENHRDTSTSGAEYVTNEQFTFREGKTDKGRSLAVVDANVTTTVGGETETPVGAYKVAGNGKGKFEFTFNPASGSITWFKGSMDTSIDMTPQSGGQSMKTTVTNHIERELLD